MVQGGGLAAAGLLLILFFLFFRGTEKTELMETEGRNFEKAEVIAVLQDNETENGNIVGNQVVELELLSGDHKGEQVEAVSSSSYLFGAHCQVGMEVIAIVNESNGELVASVYSVNREPMIWLMAALFVLIVVLVGGRKGLSSIAGLVFTMFCIIFIFLPMIYRGVSPVLAAVLVGGYHYHYHVSD